VLLNDTIAAGESVVVQVDLANFDPARGTIGLTLTADGEVVEERTAAVGASSRRTVFVRGRLADPGTYTIALNGVELGEVTVTEVQTTVPGETPTRSPSPAAEVTPTPTEEVTGTPEATPPEGVSPTPTLPEGPGAPTGTEVVTAFVLVLALLAAVGAVVYVLPAGAV
jgi:uncharacterized surface anchored protein